MSTNEVLVALDDSASARAALRWAADYARATGAQLTAVHVHRETYPSALWGPAYIAVASDLSEHELTKLTLDAILSSVDPEPGWRVEYLEGPIGHELVKRALHAQLLVLGTHEHTGLERIITGSVSHYCLSHAICPVIAVPAEVGSTKEFQLASPA